MLCLFTIKDCFTETGIHFKMSIVSKKALKGALGYLVL
ncbi:hypothetical protein ISR6_1178 [Streptococcus pyogenes]|nr:hypothetical protein ISR6_1178 [Streptococcus pyogenes]